jgi:hypothetical protein
MTFWHQKCAFVQKTSAKNVDEIGTWYSSPKSRGQQFNIFNILFELILNSTF